MPMNNGMAEPILSAGLGWPIKRTLKPLDGLLIRFALFDNPCMLMGLIGDKDAPEKSLI